MDQHQELLAAVRSALDVLYGAGAPLASRATRRAAERSLLSLRRADARSAMGVCVVLLQGTDAAAATFAAQTVAHLCRFQEPGTNWPSSLLDLLRAAVEGRAGKPVLTQLSLAICALTARKRAWAAPELVTAVCQQLEVGLPADAVLRGHVAALRTSTWIEPKPARPILTLSPRGRHRLDADGQAMGPHVPPGILPAHDGRLPRDPAANLHSW